MLINIILFNVFTDNLFLLNYMAIHLGYLFVQDAKVITTGVCHQRDRFSKWSQVTFMVFNMIKKLAVLVH